VPSRRGKRTKPLRPFLTPVCLRSQRGGVRARVHGYTRTLPCGPPVRVWWMTGSIGGGDGGDGGGEGMAGGGESGGGILSELLASPSELLASPSADPRELTAGVVLCCAGRRCTRP
jgi:hypothetical protein